MEEAHIRRLDGEITLSEFQEAIQSFPTLVESGEHFVIDGVTGEPIYKSGIGTVYLVGERNCIGYIEYENNQLYVHNVSNDICESLSNHLGANIIPIYYHG